MGKHSVRQVAPPSRPYVVHPVWRGIGCLLTLIAPFVAIAAADLLVKMNLEKGWFPIPRDMLRPYTLPVVNYTLDNAIATLITAGLLLLLGFALMIILYSIIYSLMGPPRYSPIDSPPIRGKKH